MLRQWAAMLFCGLLFWSGVESANGYNLRRYTFPTSSSQEAFINGAFNLSGESEDTTQTGYSFSGTATYDMFYRSLPFTYFINSRGNFAFMRATQDDADGTEGFDGLLRVRGNKYFTREHKWFAFGASKLEYRKLQSSSKADDPYWDVTAGLGYGRSIDATVLKQAIRINQDFKRFGVISSDIPEEFLQQLARVIDRQSEFRSLYGIVEYRKYWYGAMEDVIRDAGVLIEDGLGAVGLIRVQEVLAEPTGRRFHGWEVRGGGGVVLSDFSGEAGDPLASAEFDWALPYTINLQFSNSIYSRTVFAEDQSWTAGDIFQIYYELTNRLDWDNSLQAEYNVAEPLPDSWDATFTSTFIFYLENQLTFNPSLIVNYFDVDGQDSKSNWTLLGSISYRLK